jgi:hypothetical protein
MGVEKKIEGKKKGIENSPPTLPRALATKLRLVLGMHPHRSFELQPLVPMFSEGRPFLLKTDVLAMKNRQR